MSSMSLELDKKSLKKILDRFDKAPKKIQRGGTRSALNAGAQVVRTIARSKAPACIAPSIKLTGRKMRGWTAQILVMAGTSHSARMGLMGSGDARNLGLRPGLDEMKHFDCYPPMWVEFGTYGNRDYMGDEPYAPSTKRKYAKSGGRSPSKFWDHPYYWIPAKPFMRPAIDSPLIEKAIAKKLGEYLTKKGF